MELRAWAGRLKLFRFFRAYGGHANDGDSLGYGLRIQEGQLELFFSTLGIELVKFDVKPPQAEIGVSYKGSMLAQFSSLIRGNAFRELGLHRVEIVVAFGNVDSEGVAIKSGALHESITRNRL